MLWTYSVWRERERERQRQREREETGGREQEWHSHISWFWVSANEFSQYKPVLWYFLVALSRTSSYLWATRAWLSEPKEYALTLSHHLLVPVRYDAHSKLSIHIHNKTLASIKFGETALCWVLMNRCTWHVLKQVNLTIYSNRKVHDIV